MSLINQMLKDLESTRRKSEKAPGILRKLRSVSDEKVERRFHPAWLLVVAVVVVALAAWLIPTKKHTPPLASHVLPAHVQQQSKKIAQVIKATEPLPQAQNQVLSPGGQQVMKKPVSMEKKPVIKQVVPLNQREKITELYAQAQQALDQSDDTKAVGLLRKLLSMDNGNLTARELLASVLLSDNQVDDAQQVIAVGLKRTPDYAPLANLQARIYMNQGKLKQAIEELNRAAPELAQAPNYYALLAALYQQDEQYMLAAQLYHQLVQLDPANGVWWMGLGIAFESAEKNNAALEAFQHAKRAVGLSVSAKAYVQQQIDKLS